MTREIPPEDSDLERIGHVCDEMRRDDLRQLAGAFGWMPPNGGAVAWTIVYLDDPTPPADSPRP